MKDRLQKLLARAAVYDFPLKTSTIAAPLMVNPDGVHAVFVLSPPAWEFETLDQRIITWDQIRSRLGQLTESVDRPGGRPFHMRVTTRPYPAYEWAARLDAHTVNPLPQVDGAESWNDYLAAGQRRLMSTGLDQKLVALSVWLGPPPSKDCLEDLTDGTEHPRKEAVTIINELAEVTELLSGGGLNARPATSEDIAFLLHRSLSMGVPPPAHVGGEKRWDADTLGEFTARSTWLAAPFGQSIEIRSETDAHPIARHVVVLAVGVMPDITWPESGADPWLLAADRLGFPVEASVHGVLLRGRQVEPKAVYEQRRAQYVEKDYAEHGMEPPPAVGRAIVQARETLDEVTEGTARQTARFSGTVRLAVYGATEDEANERARRLVAHYADLQIPLTRIKDQARALREFTLLEPRVRDGFERRMPVGYLAASAPHIDPVVGTSSGPYVGYTVLSHRAVLCDLHHGLEDPDNNRPGLFPVAGEPGSGKSVALGSLAYAAARAGEKVTILDPSGPLAVLTRLPELAPHARELSLTDSDEGALSPMQMVPAPSPESFRVGGVIDELKLAKETRAARAERAQLTFDILRQLLSPGLVRTTGVDRTLHEAIRSMRDHPRAAGVPETAWNTRWALDYLRAGDDLAQQIYHELEGASEFPRGNLIIPSHSDPVEESRTGDAVLTVITMAGLEPPPADLEREFWGVGERYAQPLMHLAAFFAARAIYSDSRDARKHLYLDEAHWLGRSPSGRAGLHRISRDSRKWNAAVLLASQDPQDHLAIGRLTALIGGCFVGRLRDDDAARRGCETLNVAPEYAPVLQALGPGEFVHKDVFGRVALMRFDMDWHPSLSSLSTTPGHARPDYDGTLPPAPFLDQRLLRGAA